MVSGGVLVARETVRPWLVVDDSEDSVEAQKLFTRWCEQYGQDCTVFTSDQVSGALAPPTLIWMGTYEGLYLIKRIVKLDPNVRYLLAAEFDGEIEG